MKASLQKLNPKQFYFPVLLVLTVVTALVFGVKKRHQTLEAEKNPPKSPTWKVQEVLTGDRFTVTKDSSRRLKEIVLCGIIPAHSESQDYLQSVINLGDGSVELEQVEKNTYEAWVMLKPDFESQIHLNTHLVEKGMALQDTRNSQKCLSHEELAMAQNLAQEEKVGIWSQQ